MCPVLYLLIADVPMLKGNLPERDKPPKGWREKVLALGGELIGNGLEDFFANFWHDIGGIFHKKDPKYDRPKSIDDYR